MHKSNSTETLTSTDHASVGMLSSECPKLSALDGWLEPATPKYQSFLDPDHYVPGTGTWFYESSAFQLLAQSRSSSFLWVHGHPGMGKSILAASTVSNIRKHDSGFCAYFFCDWADPTKRSGNSIIRTIASQLAQENSDVFGNINDLFLQNFSLTQPLPLLWRKLVGNQVIHFSERIYIVIDGLDECDIEDRKMLMRIIASTENQAMISWLVFSHYLPDIAKFLVGPNFAVTPYHNDKDLRAYIEQCVSRSRILSRSRIKDEVINTLQAKAGGVFLWVKLIVQELDMQPDVEDVLAVLESPPRGIEELYEGIFNRLSRVLTEEQLRVVSTAFGWIAAVSRPMTIIELTKAVELSLPDIGELLDLKVILQENCNGLVTVSTSNVVKFIHQTVQQYVYSSPHTNFPHINSRAIHVAISKACLSYLSRETFARSISSARFHAVNAVPLVEKHPLLPYACIYWAEHVALAGMENYLELIEQLTAILCSNNILVAIEVAVAVGGIDTLQQWVVALSKFQSKFVNAPESQLVLRFAADLKQIVLRYGHALNKYPGEIFYLIDERFPRRSHFWKYFGNKGVFLENGQSEEWDPIITTFDNVRVSCIAINRDGIIAASGNSGVSILNSEPCLEIGSIEVSDGSVIAIAFSDAEEVMAILCQDGTLILASTQSWQVTQKMSRIVQLPVIVREWDEHQFWNFRFLHFDPVHVNLGFVGKGVLAGNTLIYPAIQREKLAFRNMSLASSTSNFASTTAGDLVGLAENGMTIKRRLGQASVSRISESMKDRSTNPSSTWRLLAVSTTSRLIATCTITFQSGYSISQSILDCVDINSTISCLNVDLGKQFRITAAAFSSDESLLAANAYNSQILLDITKIWRLSDKPQLIWERKMLDEHTTSLAFGLNDTILVKAGRFLRVWDVNMIFQDDASNTFPLNLPLKICSSGTQVGSVPGDHVSVENPKLFLWRVDQANGPAKIPWPAHLCQPNLDAIRPLAFSADGALIVWDHAVISTENYEVIDVIPLNRNEEVCHVGGFNCDSSTIVYSVHLKPPKLQQQDILTDPLLTNAAQIQPSGDPTQYIMKYDRTSGEVEKFYSSSCLALLRPHPSLPFVGFVAKEPGGEWTAYIYNFQLRQFIAKESIFAGWPSIPVFQDIAFSDALVVAYPQKKCNDGDDFLAAWDGVNIFHLQYRAASSSKHVQSDSLRTMPWHSCHLLPSGRVVYFAQDGWVVLWDDSFGMKEVKYISSSYGWPKSVGCTAVVEVDGYIRVVLRDISMGLLCFDFEPRKL